MAELDVDFMSRLDPDFWRGKRVVLTGHSGFKGGWLTIWLHRLGAEVTGIGLPPITEPNLFSLAKIHGLCDSNFCDIRDEQAVARLIRDARPKVILHLAAQPLVRASYRDPIATFSTNVMGTANVLNAMRGVDGLKVAVFVTTDKVYRNVENVLAFREDDALGGHDPYSASKAASEIVIASYRDSFLGDRGVLVASARAGNVIGGGDWSEDRLLPDAIRAWQADQLLLVRRPHAVRPWQHVLEPLFGYLSLVQNLWEQPLLMGAYNFGPAATDAATVQEVVEMARAGFGTGQVRYSEGFEGPHESDRLTLDITKSCDTLGIRPRWTLPLAIQRTVSWYSSQRSGADARDLCEAEIAAYESIT
jgi:CDP-glucose 4,6-dehydratase